MSRLLLALADRLAVPLRFYPADHLDRETPRVAQPSQVVFDEIGTHSVAEASALAAAGKGGSMLAGKRKTAHATAAIAISPDGDHLGQYSRTSRAGHAGRDWPRTISMANTGSHPDDTNGR